VNFNHFHSLTQNILLDTLAQLLGTIPVTSSSLVPRAADNNMGQIGV